MMITQHHVKATQKVIILPPLLVKERSPWACMEVADPPRKPRNITNKNNQNRIVHMFLFAWGRQAVLGLSWAGAVKGVLTREKDPCIFP